LWFDPSWRRARFDRSVARASRIRVSRSRHRNEAPEFRCCVRALDGLIDGDRYFMSQWI
jgi:hypothetical protein